MTNFKVGDKVKSTVDYQTFTIKEIKDNRYAVEENVYLWSDEFLIPVEKNMTPKEALEVIEDDRYSLPILSDFDDAVIVVRQALNEYEELKCDVKRYFELANEEEATKETLDEFSEIRNKLLKVGK